MIRLSKPVSASEVVSYRLMMPSDANPAGNIHGGIVLKMIDEVGGIVAYRHARMNVVTASIDRVDFFHPVKVGDLLILKSAVNYVGRTSMEVGVRVESENLTTGAVKHVGSSYMTFVAMDKSGRPAEIPDIQPVTDKEISRYDDGAARRRARLGLLRRRS